MPWLTTYATYMESLEQGQIVPAVGPPTYTNAGQALAPFTSYQYEVGAKATVGGTLLTAALFRHRQGAAVRGEQRQRHLHLRAERQGGTQRVRVHRDGQGNKHNLTLFGGLTLMNAQITKDRGKSAV